MLISPFLIIVALLMLFPQRESAERKFHRIAEGMTKDQVLEIVGSTEIPQPVSFPSSRKSYSWGWRSDEKLIIVRFDLDDVVLEKCLYDLAKGRTIEHPLVENVISQFWPE